MSEPMNTGMSPADLEAAKKAEADAKAKKKAEDAAAKQAVKDAAAKKKAEEKAAKDAQKKADADAKIKAKQEAEAKKLEAKQSTKQPMQNDVRRPKPESLCGQCWAEYDRLTLAQGGNPAAISDAKKNLEAKGINEATIRTQYAHWRKFNGISGRVVSPNQAPPTPAPTPAAAPVAPVAPPPPAPVPTKS